MIKRFILALTIGLSAFTTNAGSYRNITISLLTASPGTELYSLFGHSAIRIQDPLKDIDIVYNYGVFDFNTPNFGLRFLRGSLDYMLAVNRYSDFFQSYLFEERSLYEQTLNLNTDQKEKIATLLEENYLPENRFYRYSFLSDNCATRIRDIIIKAVNDSSLFNRADVAYPKLSYRKMMNFFLGDFPWVDFGINLAMGLPADKITTTSEKMFLPEYMKQIAAKSKFKNGEPLVIESRTLLSDLKEPYQTINILTPISVFFSILTLSLLGFSAKKYSRIFCSVFYFLIGLLGVVLTLTTFATDHAALKGNLNLLWAIPFNIVMFRSAGKVSISKLERYYFIAIALVAIFILSTWGKIPQTFHPAIIPILITIIITSAQISFHRYVPQKGKASKETIKKKRSSSLSKS